MSGTNVVAEQITGASSYIDSMTGINLYENLITSTSITGGTENINSIVVSSSLFIPTTSSGVTGSTGVGSMYFSSNDNKLHIYNGTGWKSSQLS